MTAHVTHSIKIWHLSLSTLVTALRCHWNLGWTLQSTWPFPGSFSHHWSLSVVWHFWWLPPSCRQGKSLVLRTQIKKMWCSIFLNSHLFLFKVRLTSANFRKTAWSAASCSACALPKTITSSLIFSAPGMSRISSLITISKISLVEFVPKFSQAYRRCV